MYNMDSEGYEINTFLKVANVTVCQAICQEEDEECQYFVYNEKTRSCDLLFEQAFNMKFSSEGHIFGPKFCSGMCKWVNNTNR